MSGIDITTPFPGLNFYTISHIRPNSPADLVGLRKGDEIFLINGTPASRFDMKEITSIFQDRPNRKIKMVIKRNGETLKYSFILSDII